MKKLICLFLTATLIFALFIPAFAESGIKTGDAVLSIDGIVTGKLNTGYASIETTFTNNTEKDVSVSMIIAEYNTENGFRKLCGSACETKNVPAGKTVTAVPGINVSSANAEIRYFAYNSLTLEPIAVKKFVTENFKLVGTDSEISVYRIFSFKNMNDTVSGKPISETLSAPAVETWKDGKVSATSVTMDDGVYDAALKYLELFKKYNIHATEFIITGSNVDNQTESVKNWQNIFDTGYIDLGNHSYNHSIKYNDSSSYTQKDIEHDITDSYIKLKTLFPTQSVLTFASPWGQTPDNAVNEMKKNHYANRIAGGDIVSGKTPSDFFRIPTIAVQYGTSAADLNARVDKAISTGGWNTELYHGIGTSGSSSNSYSTNISVMEEHLKYINSKSDKVWAGSFNEVIKYIYERDSASVKQLWATDKSIGIKVTDKMDDDLFNYPLTVKVNLPSSWSGEIKYTQSGGKSGNSVIFKENGKNYAYAEAVPDKGNVVITMQ